jgi:hypothetical protein
MKANYNVISSNICHYKGFPNRKWESDAMPAKRKYDLPTHILYSANK